MIEDGSKELFNQGSSSKGSNIENKSYMEGNKMDETQTRANQEESKTDYKSTNINELMNKVNDVLGRISDDNDNRGISKKADSVQEQWRKVGQIRSMLYDTQKEEELTDKQKETRDKRIVAKIKTFESICKLTFGMVNPYKIEEKVVLRKFDKTLSQLESNLNSYQNELNGIKNFKNVKNSYSGLIQTLPEQIRETGEVKNLVDIVNKLNGNNSNGKGIKSKLNYLTKDLNDAYIARDVIDAALIEYSGKISTTKTKIKALASTIEDKADPQTMSKLVDMKSIVQKYEQEQEMLIESYDLLCDGIDDKLADYKHTTKDVDVLEGMAIKTKEGIRSLKYDLKEAKRRGSSEKRSVLLGSHAQMIDLAYKQGIKLRAGNYMADETLGGQLDKLGNIRNPGKPNGIDNSYKFKEFKEKAKSERNQRIEEGKNLIMKELYTQ